jgi:hypothetical protein
MSEKKSKTSGEGNAPRITAGNQQDSQPARSLDAALRGRIIGPKRQTGGEESDTASDAPHEDAGVGESQAHQPEAPWWGEDQRPSMTIALSCYRKAYPQEILFQLEPVLRKIGIRWWEIIGLFQEYLRQRASKYSKSIPVGQMDTRRMRSTSCTSRTRRFLPLTQNWDHEHR